MISTYENTAITEADSRFRELVIEAAARPTSTSVETPLHELNELVSAAVTDDSANSTLQRWLYWLHYGDHEPSHALRQWLASTTYGYFEQTATEVAIAELNTSAFANELATAQEALSPLHHPLFHRCFATDGDFDDLKIYLRHKWIIMLTFWRSLSDFGMRIQRNDLHNTALVYENVHEELGSGRADEAHLIQHYDLLKAIGVDVSWDDQPEFTETMEYLNFRVFCMRHPELSWGLGSFYSQEATSLEYTLGHYHQLRRFGVSHEVAEIYHAHDEIDAEHTDEILTIIDDLVTDDERRAMTLRAQRHQMRLWNNHFDRVLQHLDGGGTAS